MPTDTFSAERCHGANVPAPASRFTLAGAERDGTSGGTCPYGECELNRAVSRGQLYARIQRYRSVEMFRIASAAAALDLAANLEVIDQWRDSLPEEQRRRLIQPLSVTRRWRASTQHNGRLPRDYRRDAMAAWRRFVSCVEALPTDQSWAAVRIYGFMSMNGAESWLMSASRPCDATWAASYVLASVDDVRMVDG